MSTLITDKELLVWLIGKTDEAAKAVRSRQQSEACFRGGTDKSWAAAADLHPSTKGNGMKREERLKAADIQARIAIKCQHEVDMFKALLSKIQP